MKQNYIFCLIGILSIYNVAFSMEPQAVKDFKAAYDAAKNFETAGNMDKALAEYGKAAKIEIPKTLPGGGYTYRDPYPNERRQQEEAIEKLKKAAEKLESEKKYKQALAIYNYAPTYFEFEIDGLEKTINDELEKAQTELDKAQNLVNGGKYQEAINILAKLLIPEGISDVVQQAATKLLTDIEKKQEASTARKPGELASDKALISALQNLKNGFIQIGKKMASK